MTGSLKRQRSYSYSPQSLLIYNGEMPGCEYRI